MDEVRWLSTLGVGGVIAGFVFLFYRKDMHRFTELWKEQSEANMKIASQLMEVVRSNTEAMTRVVNTLEPPSQIMNVVKDNTIALTKVVQVVESLHRRVDGIKEFPARDRDRERPEENRK